MAGKMTQAQRELVEEFGLLYEEMGSTRMCGRVGGWLLLCDPPVQSLTEIAEGLGVSKAAVSGAARLLLQNHVVERVGEPGQRGDFYRALPVDADGLIPVAHVRTAARHPESRPRERGGARPDAVQLRPHARAARAHRLRRGGAAADARALARAPLRRRARTADTIAPTDPGGTL